MKKISELSLKEVETWAQAPLHPAKTVGKNTC